MNDKISVFAADYWTDRYQRSYSYIHSGNIKFKVNRKSAMNMAKGAIFKRVLSLNIKKLLDSSFGYIQIREDSDILLRSLDSAGVKLPLNYSKNKSIMYIEDDEIYVYEDGMSHAQKIRWCISHFIFFISYIILKVKMYDAFRFAI